MFGAIGGQVTHGLPFAHGSFKVSLELGQGADVLDAGSFALLMERRLHAHPHDGVDGEFVAEDDLAILVDVDDGHQAGVG